MKRFILLIAKVVVPSSKLSKDKLNKITDETYTRIRSKEFAYIPAGTALYLFVSFIPILVIISTIELIPSPYINQVNGESITYANVLSEDILARLIPGINKVMPNLTGLFAKNQSGGSLIAILLIVSAVWISSRGYTRFIESISIFYNHDRPSNFFKTKIKALWIVICLTAFLYVVILLFTLFLAYLRSEGYDHKGWQFLLIYYILMTFFVVVFFIIGYLLLFKFAANFRLKFSDIAIGAFISAIPSSIFSITFGFISSIAKYEKWGSVSSFMYVQLFILFMSYFTYIGILFNASYYKTFISSVTIDKNLKLSRY
ncbi:YihY/virulence factor BrkB family protein [Mycoplasma sp. 1573]